MAIANMVIFRLDAAQDRRQLSPGEAWLRKMLKLSLLGLASLERTIARQGSRIRWLAEGDANTELFHVVAHGRHIKNFIPTVRVGDEIVTEQDHKLDAFMNAYMELLRKVQNRQFSLNMEFLHLPRLDLSDLEVIFTEEEVWKVIKEMPQDRAPGPDCFIGIFYQKAWSVIKHDVMAAILKLFVGDGKGFGRLNQALITLIPKKEDAILVGDFRPISLVHSFSKLFSKLLANRLKFRLGELITANQSAFVRGRCLHDNFILVRQLARKINSRREKCVLIKLDLTRAFDSISWAFLFEVLRGLGFGHIFLKWISIILSSASTRVTVNGVPGNRIKHVKGLRQGDPISPMLFNCGMEALTVLITRAI
jgi:hypothetical protein